MSVSAITATMWSICIDEAAADSGRRSNRSARRIASSKKSACKVVVGVVVGEVVADRVRSGAPDGARQLDVQRLGRLACDHQHDLAGLHAGASAEREIDENVAHSVRGPRWGACRSCRDPTRCGVVCVRVRTGMRRAVFRGECGIGCRGSCIAAGRPHMFTAGRGTSRKERGHRGVRPRHPETGSALRERPTEEGSSNGSLPRLTSFSASRALCDAGRSSGRGRPGARALPPHRPEAACLPRRRRAAGRGLESNSAPPKGSRQRADRERRGALRVKKPRAIR